MAKEYLEQFRKDIENCAQTRCGVCVSGSPCFKKGGFESTSPKGYMRIALGLLNGELEMDDTIRKRLAVCTTCGYCGKKCTIDVSKIVEALRSIGSNKA